MTCSPGSFGPDARRKELAREPCLDAGQAVTLGVADGIGDLRTVLRQRFGEDVRMPLIGPERSLFGRTRPGVGLRERLFGGVGFADELISAVEERALWSRYGL